MKTKVIAFANNKGGSGKTTTVSNVGAALALMGKRVLMIDADMQLNLTLSFFDEDTAYEYARGENGSLSEWKTVSGTSDIFSPNTSWEPGRTEVIYFKVVNFLLSLTYS